MEGATKRIATSQSERKVLQSISVEEGASGKGHLVMRRVPKDAALGKKAGKSRRRVKNLSTKLKAAAAAATLEAKMPAVAGPAAAAESGKEVEAKKPAAAAAAEAEAGKELEAKKPAAAVPVDAAESDTTGKELFVDCFIVDPDEYYARRINDPDPFFSREYVERSTQTFRDVAEFCKKTCMRVQGYGDELDDDDDDDDEEEEEEEEEEDYYLQAFGPIPQSVIDEIDARISGST